MHTARELEIIPQQCVVTCHDLMDPAGREQCGRDWERPTELLPRRNRAVYTCVDRLLRRHASQTQNNNSQLRTQYPIYADHPRSRRGPYNHDNNDTRENQQRRSVTHLWLKRELLVNVRHNVHRSLLSVEVERQAVFLARTSRGVVPCFLSNLVLCYTGNKCQCTVTVLFFMFTPMGKEYAGGSERRESGDMRRKDRMQRGVVNKPRQTNMTQNQSRPGVWLYQAPALYFNLECEQTSLKRYVNHT